MIQIKRAYDPPARGDGRRFLVERLWPRGVTKDALDAEAWLKDVAPSAELRTWYAHQVERWPEFQRRYRAELDAHPEAWQPLADADARGPITLLYAARDTEHNSALVLCEYLEQRRGKRSARAEQSARTEQPGRAKSADAKPARTKSARTKSAHAKSADAKSANAKPARAKRSAKPKRN